METKTAKTDKARFDTRLSKEQKDFFERAVIIGGYRNLTDFIVLSAQEKAKEIIMDNEKILASEKDATIFFEAIMNPPKPNQALMDGFELYKKMVSQ